MRIPIIALAVFLSTAISSSVSAKEVAQNKMGSLEVYANDVVIRKCENRVCFQATLALTIRNTGNSAMRVALMNSSNPTLHLDDGTQYETYKFTGITHCNYTKTVECDQMHDNFELIQPGEEIYVNFILFRDTYETKLRPISSGRLSGKLYVRNQATGKSWPVTLSIKDIPIKQY